MTERLILGDEYPVLLVGITGKAGAGKDTVADHVATQLHRVGMFVQKMSFSDSLKQMAAILTNDPVANFHDVEKKKEFLPFPWDKFTRRHLLQILGTEAIRESVMQDAWVASVYSKCQTLQNETMFKFVKSCDEYSDVASKTKTPLVILLPDTRFDNEAEFISDNMGLIIEITSNTIDQTAVGHASEGGLKKEYINASYFNDKNDPGNPLRISLDVVDKIKTIVWQKAGLRKEFRDHE